MVWRTLLKKRLLEDLVTNHISYKWIYTYIYEYEYYIIYGLNGLLGAESSLQESLAHGEVSLHTALCYTIPGSTILYCARNST